MLKFDDSTAKKTAPPIIASPLNDIVIAAIFTDADSAGLAAEYLVKDVLGEYGKHLGKVVSVTAQDYHKLVNFRGCRVDVVCRTDDNELWLVEFQMYDDEFMYERNLVELSYLIINSTSAGTTVEEMAEDIPHIVVINFLDFKIRTDNPDWLQPVHLTYDKEPQRVAYYKLEIFNIQLPLFTEREPDFSNDGECWLYVMYQAHIKKMTPGEVLEMDSKLERFATTNPGFRQFETRFRQAIADPELLDLLRMEASERIRQAGMKKAVEKNKAKEIAQNMLSDGESIEKIIRYTELTREEIENLHNTE
ncbi:MAG: Rpn family recombination-promoting nuclease/putative transposase [Clostridiales bacterium]|jgi:predicted transposase/invertase (TIGR01784 family)|nr:Rpn family recombination-promoting nuclease/putative transposase [Clostridiales bacterium]